MPSVLSQRPIQPAATPGTENAHPAGSRDFADASETRRRIFDNVRDAARKLPPLSNQQYTLRLADVDYQGPERYSLADQKRAVLNRKSLGRRLTGTWELLDNSTGEPVDRHPTTLADVPYLTDRGTFLYGGNEYTVSHQLRLKPGIFTREKDNGELESHINVMPGQGVSQRIFLDPETGVFRAKIGQARIPLISMLQALGVQDKQLREAWGNELYAANMRKAQPGDLNKLYSRLVRGGQASSAESKQQALAEAISQSRLDPEVVKRTLGQPFDRVSAESLLATTRKLLAVRNRDNPERLRQLGLEPQDPDDRDSLAYMRVYGPEDLFAERVGSDRQALQRLLWRATGKRSARSVPPRALDRAIKAAILGSGLGMPVESINPAQIFEQQGRVTRMGVGGIPSIDAIPASSRSVQPSHFGFIDPLITPESARAGVDSRMSRLTRKGKDGELYAPFRDVRTGQLVWKQPKELADTAIAFPGEMRRGEPTVHAMSGGRVKYVPRDRVNYEMPHFENAFAFMNNLVPAKSAVKGQRAVMAARMLTQALPLQRPEAPLVQSAVPDEQDKSFEELYGEQMGALRAKQGGRVVATDHDSITVRYEDGSRDTLDLYNNYPNNRKTPTHQEAVVKPGDTFAPGDLLATSNYTDKNGTAALGLNARTAYLPYDGLNFEDAIVVSEGFARRASSQHMYQHPVEFDKDRDKTGRKSFVGIFPGTYSRRMLENIDEDGVVKRGAVVRHGDPLVLVARERTRTAGQIHRGRQPSHENASEVWEHHTPGVVTDVEKTPKGPVVVVKSASPMEVGDKLSGRYGDKGVIAKVVPDDQMPHGKDGKPFEVLLNPLGIISRGNPAQTFEASLGKIAARTGRPYKVRDFEDIDDLRAFAEQELRRHGMKSTEDVVDPRTDRHIPGIQTGNRFFMKLHHTAESKSQGRGFGSYTAEGTPAKGGKSGSKRVGMLELNALLSHGAVDTIRDANLIRGQRNPDYWAAYMSGHKPPVPQVPFVYKKFLGQLQAAGIHPVRQGTQTHIMALTNQDVDRLSGGRELRNAETVDWKQDLKPRPGGLFDESLTGGHGGNKWSHIKLAEPLPSPVMEEPIRRMLGLTKQKLRDVIAGKEQLNGNTGPAAIRQALDNLDIDNEIRTAQHTIETRRGATRDQAVRKLGYLKAAKKRDLHPRDWVLEKVPVLPPAFRPVSMMAGTQVPLVSDPNYLYKELFDANRTLEDLHSLSDDVGDERLAVYDAFKGVVGLGDPLQAKNQERRVRGILKHIFGRSPKFGCFDDETEILTRRGWLRFVELESDDVVMTMNPVTGAAEWQHVDEIHRYDYVGEMLRFETKRGLDMVVTPNHRNWVRPRQASRSQDDMESGWDFEPAYVTAASRGRRWFRTAASDWAGTFVRPSFLPTTVSSRDFAAFVGWWAAEGWLGDRDRSSVSLCQAVSQEDYCLEIRRVLTALGMPFGEGDYEKRVPSGKTILATQWWIRSRELADWLTEHVGNLAARKHLSAEVKDWPTDELEAFLFGYLRGDGGKRHKPRRNQGGVTHRNRAATPWEHGSAATTSTRLADDIVEIACKLGLVGRKSVTREETVTETGSVWRTLYKINLDTSRFVVAEGSIESVVDYEGEVHCVSVENGVVYVRRNGKPFFSGNSVQRRLLGSTTDMVGRSVITPNPDLDMDQVGLPEEQAWEVYTPHIVRRLVKQGVPRTTAVRMIKERQRLARQALVNEMEDRPVIINRAPVLHRYGVMAAWPRLAPGSTLQVSPLVVGGFGADFDGDAMQYHVPGSDDARDEAVRKLLPSRNLLSVSDFGVEYKPSQEYVGGLFAASTQQDEAPVVSFRSKADAIRAYRTGKIGLGQRVRILE